MTIDLRWVRETEKAVFYERAGGGRIWVPRSVIVGAWPLPEAQFRSEGWMRVQLKDWFLKANGNWHSHFSLCQCGHVTMYPPTFFAGARAIDCAECGKPTETPTLR